MFLPTQLTLLVLVACAVEGAVTYYGPTSNSTALRNSTYTLAASFSGASFFDGFNPFTGADPTKGHIDYVDLQQGTSSGLAGIYHNSTTNRDLAYIGVDSKNQAPNGRQSMRLESSYNVSSGSIVVADILHMPTGCGTWPAFWMLGGGEWPYTGEIDIVEAVNDDNFNHVTLHTSAGMNVKNNKQLFQGQLSDTNCNANKATEGCSAKINAVVNGMATAGEKFNQQKGGVYVTTWDDKAISVYLFARDQQPADLVAGKPNPSSWTAKPIAQFEPSAAAIDKHFQNMRLILNVDVCGDWAGSDQVWQSSCAAITKCQTCTEFASNNPAAFKEAYWLVDSIKVYSSAGHNKRDIDSKTNSPNFKLDSTTDNEVQPLDHSEVSHREDGSRGGTRTPIFTSNAIKLEDGRLWAVGALMLIAFAFFL